MTANGDISPTPLCPRKAGFLFGKAPAIR